MWICTYICFTAFAQTLFSTSHVVVFEPRKERRTCPDWQCACVCIRLLLNNRVSIDFSTSPPSISADLLLLRTTHARRKRAWPTNLSVVRPETICVVCVSINKSYHSQWRHVCGLADVDPSASATSSVIWQRPYCQCPHSLRPPPSHHCVCVRVRHHAITYCIENSM